jgi:regulating synaptic membrane exocytosis protein 2
VLEVTVWDFNRFGENDFLGEATIDLGNSPLDEEPEWYYLNLYKGGLPEHLKQSLVMERENPALPPDHLSPPSTTSRHSDSEVSDFDEAFGLGRRGRSLPGQEAASLSGNSLGSSSSPTADHDYTARGGGPTSGPGRKIPVINSNSRGLYAGRPPMRISPQRRRLPQIPRKGYEVDDRPLVTGGTGGGRNWSSSASYAGSYRGEGKFNSMERGRRMAYGKNSSNYGGNSGYSDTEMLSERHDDRDTYLERHRTRLDRLRRERDQQAQNAGNEYDIAQSGDMRQWPVRDDRKYPDYDKRMNMNYPYSGEGAGGTYRQQGMQYESDRQRSDYFEHSDIESVISASALTVTSVDPQRQRETENKGQGSVQFGGQTEGTRLQTYTTNTVTSSLPKGILRTTSTVTTVSESSDKNDGSLSDTAVSSFHVANKSGRSGQGMGKKSSSTSQLSDAGRTRRIGLLGAKRTTITVHRSEEVIPVNITVDRRLVRQGTSVSSDGEAEMFPDTCSESWLTSTSREGQLSEFIEGLGPGQLVGRQVLGSPVLGDIQLSMCDKRGDLEVEVIRARGLQSKAGSKVLPAPWVKVYLVSGKKCLAKAKTSPARRTLDPLFQQQLTFHERYGGCVLQVTVWGDYGRVEGKKVFMGVAQIMLDDLDLSNIVIGWYKLFGTSSLVSVPPGGGKDNKQKSLNTASS